MISLILGVAAGSSPPSWTGSIPTWLLLILAAAAAFRVTRGGGGSAVSELSKANDVLTEALAKTKQDAERQSHQIAELQSKTDVVLAVTPLIAEHERLAQERHKATIVVLQEMAATLATINTNGHPTEGNP